MRIIIIIGWVNGWGSVLGGGRWGRPMAALPLTTVRRTKPAGLGEREYTAETPRCAISPTSGWLNRLSQLELLLLPRLSENYGRHIGSEGALLLLREPCCFSGSPLPCWE